MQVINHEQLRAARKRSGLSRTAAAYHLNVSAGTVAKYETGRATPSVRVLVAMGALYAVEVDELLRSTASADVSTS